MNETLLQDRRELVIDRLSTSYAQGHFEVDELEHRLARAHAAQTPAELDALVTDLVPAAATMALVPVQHTRVVFGSVERTGPWTVPAQMTARVVCGSLELDLRDAKLTSHVTTIDVRVTMGSVEIVVPPGVEVEVAASSVLGSVEERVERSSATGAPIVRVVGRVKLGSLEVETRQAGETERDARWRRRYDRRMQRRWRHERRALRAGCDRW
jgi:hypothetical protein